MTKTTSSKKLQKILLSAGLSLTIAFSGTMVIPPQPTYAATLAQQKATANKIVTMSKKYMGTPYKFGAKSGNTNYFDCSSFTQFLFKKAGISIPRTSKAQSKVGTFVKKSNLRVGDLVFFYSPIHHVGLYIGNGKFIHTYGKPGVTISNLNTGFWSKNYTTARRVIK